MSKKEKKKRWQLILLFLLLLIVLSCTTLIIVYINKNSMNPDYNAGKIDKNVYEIPGDGEEVSSEGGSVSLSYSKKVTINKAKNLVSLTFKNPSISNQDVVIKLVTKETNEAIAESDVIPAGYGINKLELNEDYNPTVSNFEATIQVYYYDSETHEKAIVNTSILVYVNVI